MKNIRENFKKIKRYRRHRRIRVRVHGNAKRPRFSVFKSNRYLSVQLIDDEKGITVATASTRAQKGKNPMEKAVELGRKISEIAKEKKIKEVVFDRGGYLYAGKIKALADSARKEGLKF